MHSSRPYRNARRSARARPGRGGPIWREPIWAMARRRGLARPPGPGRQSRRLVRQHRQRPMHKPRSRLQPPIGCPVVGEGDGAEAADQQTQHDGHNSGQHRQMQPAWQQRWQVQQRGAEENPTAAPAGQSAGQIASNRIAPRASNRRVAKCRRSGFWDFMPAAAPAPISLPSVGGRG